MEELLDRAANGDIDAVIQIGEAVEKVYAGQFGVWLRAAVNGLKSSEIARNLEPEKDKTPLNADRVLGRLEGFEKVIWAVESVINEKNNLTRQVKQDRRVG